MLNFNKCSKKKERAQGGWESRAVVRMHRCVWSCSVKLDYRYLNNNSRLIRGLYYPPRFSPWTASDFHPVGRLSPLSHQPGRVKAHNMVPLIHTKPDDRIFSGVCGITHLKSFLSTFACKRHWQWRKWATLLSLRAQANFANFASRHGWLWHPLGPSRWWVKLFSFSLRSFRMIITTRWHFGPISNPWNSNFYFYF